MSTLVAVPSVNPHIGIKKGVKRCRRQIGVSGAGVKELMLAPIKHTQAIKGQALDGNGSVMIMRLA